MNGRHEFARHVADLLGVLGPVRWRVMFGGYGFYCGELFFALLSDETLYFKADAESRPLFEAEGLDAFVYEKQGKPFALSYYRVPDDVFEDRDLMRHWGNLALEAAWRAGRKKVPKAAPRQPGRKTKLTDGH